MPRALRAALLVVVSVVAGAGPEVASAQYFGRNKVEYADFDFSILQSAHFEVYYYPREAEAARLAVRLAERWHARLAQVLGQELRGRQPLILYASHPEFAQTNVVSSFLGEGTGGVTESGRRRIVMPFAPTLAETDHVLGHEIVHAFQFDLLRGRAGGWPLWAIEGMAEYLSRGASDATSAMWIRDAVATRQLPRDHKAAARSLSPYHYGHAMWAYLAGRFGDQVVPQVLTARGSFARRIREATGLELDALFADFRRAAHERHGAGLRRADEAADAPRRRERVQLGPSLSPDGRHAVLFSDADRLSLDLFLVDTGSGAIRRKLASTAASIGFENLQAVRSTGAWSWNGQRFAFPAIRGGQAVLVVLDVGAPGVERVLPLPQLGQVFTPTWSPDDRMLAFSALHGGVTDLYTLELSTGTLRQLTDDAFADLHPAWAPDGRRLVFATDRFSTDLAALRFGSCQLASVDLDTGGIVSLAPAHAGEQTNPRWSADGRSVFFVSAPSEAGNVFRLDLDEQRVYEVSGVPAGVAGLTPSSPSLSVAARAPVLAFTVYRGGRHVTEFRHGPSILAGEPLERAPAATDEAGGGAEASVVARMLSSTTIGRDAADAVRARPYEPRLSLEGIGHPYVSTGGGALGSFVRGGGAVYFGDVLGERKLAASLQVGSRLRDLALGVRFLNRERRWNWGALLELEPSIRRFPSTRLGERDGERTLTSEARYLQRVQLRGAGLLAYPLNRWQRLELTAGIRHARFREDVRSRVVSLETGRVLTTASTAAAAGAPATLGEVGAAFVGDTAVHGPVGPILGSRYRFEVTPSIGDLSLTRLLVDYRRYAMPVRPYTLAVRLMHLGQYGPDAEDPRLAPVFLGSRYFVRGYGWGSLRCEWTAAGDCVAQKDFLGSRLLVANAEVRFPVLGVASRELTYASLPAEGFLFADSGLVWHRREPGEGFGRRWVSSAGAGLRLRALGLPFEIAGIHALDEPARGWSLDFSFRPSF